MGHHGKFIPVSLAFSRHLTVLFPIGSCHEACVYGEPSHRRGTLEHAKSVSQIALRT